MVRPRRPARGTLTKSLDDETGASETSSAPDLGVKIRGRVKAPRRRAVRSAGVVVGDRKIYIQLNVLLMLFYVNIEHSHVCGSVVKERASGAVR
jgi:hypothetical protein